MTFISIPWESVLHFEGIMHLIERVQRPCQIFVLQQAKLVIFVCIIIIDLYSLSFYRTGCGHILSLRDSILYSVDLLCVRHMSFAGGSRFLSFHSL